MFSSVVQRSLHPINTLEVSFSALVKDFRSILHPSWQILHHNFQAYTFDADGNEKATFTGNICSLVFVSL
jgi:hypothetical protein